MLLRDNPYFAILCLTAVISGCVAFTAWIRRESAPATRPFTGLMVAIAAYASSAAIGAASSSSQSTIFWATLETVCSSAVTALFFTFTLHFTQRRAWLTRRRRGTLWAIPIFNMVLVLTNPWHHGVWTHFTTMPEGLLKSPVLVFHHGPGYLWLAAWFYVYVLTGTLMVAREALGPSTLYRQQANTVIVSTLPPIIGGTIQMLELKPPEVNLLPMSFLLTGLIYFTSLFRFRLFDLRPVARDTLIENMADGVLVIDHQGRVIDMNPAAWHFSQRQPTLPSGSERPYTTNNRLIGQPIDVVLSQWPALIPHCQKELHSTGNTEVLVSMTHHLPRHINLRFNPLRQNSNHRPFLLTRTGQPSREDNGQHVGTLLVIRDMTEQYQTQFELKQSNEILEQRLSKIEALQGQLKEQAIRDDLTKLFNRRYFEEALQAEMTKARRAKTPLAVILVDIDHFKRVNDTYGHQAGDLALQIFSNLIREHLRASDIACRYGGEEFILALPNTTLGKAYERAEQLRIAFKETAIQYKGRVIQSTISGGVGAFPEYEGSQDGMISAVDKALYAAKEDGRDRIYKIRLDNTPQRLQQHQPASRQPSLP
ncbi:MAG: histidine kinase N-terminal 7TM domain-containing protein [Cyanobacteria bacterium P01_F01_bin.53]